MTGRVRADGRQRSRSLSLRKTCSATAKIGSLAALKRNIALLRKQGKTIAFTNGCFDILHVGHVRYLQAAKKRDRVLIVGLNSDASVRRIKGPQRPIVPQDERAEVLAALTCVDFIQFFDEDTPARLIEALQPDVLIKGADWKDKGVVGSDTVIRRGGTVEYMTYVEGRSSTNIIQRIAETCVR